MKVAYEFDPFELLGVDAPRGNDRRAALEEMADYVRTEVLSYVADSESPVSGGRFKSTLSPEYAKLKKKLVGNAKANLELSGDMLDALECVVKSNGMLELRVTGKEGDKADGHNNFSGRSTLPPREFIPNEAKGQTFKRSIIRGMKEIADNFMPEED